MRVYCSGPLFSPEERAAMSSIAEVLESAGHETFLPHRDGLEPYVFSWVDNAALAGPVAPLLGRLTSKAIFALDVFQVVEGCQALVFNMNGRAPDEGAVAETAIAFATGKPLVIYKDDPRTLLGGEDNSMVVGLSATFDAVKNLGDIPDALERAVRRAGRPDEVILAPSVAKIVHRGRRIWGLLEKWHRRFPRSEEDLEALRVLLRDG